MYAYLSNNYRYLLLVALHLQSIAHLNETNSAFSITETNNLVKRPKEFECASDHLTLCGASTHVGDDTGEKMQRVDILENVGGLIGDEKNIEVL
jgi:hypothetical protein